MTVLTLPAADLAAHCDTTNDPKFQAAAMRAAEAQREAAARRAAVVARIILDLLPTAAYLSFTFSERYSYSVEVLTVRDADHQLLLTHDDEADGADGTTRLPTLHSSVTDQIACMVSIVESHDASYMSEAAADNPDWDLRDEGVYQLNLADAIADVERYDSTPEA